jgi:hypothetical protein
MHIVPAIQGWHWIRDGAKIFSRAPITWLALVFSYMLTISVAGAIPKIGPFIGVASLPAFAASFLNIARETAAGRAVPPLMLFSGFTKNTSSILALGGIYFVAFALVMMTSALFDGGDFAQLIMTGKMPRSEASGGVVVVLLGYLLILLAYWFAPALAIWQNHSAPKALFYSFFAAMRNWRALMVYGLLWGLIVAAGSWLMLVLLQTFAPAVIAGSAAKASAAGPSGMIVFILMPVLLTILSVLFASCYTCYLGVFKPSDSTS